MVKVNRVKPSINVHVCTILKGKMYSCTKGCRINSRFSPPTIFTLAGYCFQIERDFLGHDYLPANVNVSLYRLVQLGAFISLDRWNAYNTT